MEEVIYEMDVVKFSLGQGEGYALEAKAEDHEEDAQSIDVARRGWHRDQRSASERRHPCITAVSFGMTGRVYAMAWARASPTRKVIVASGGRW